MGFALVHIPLAHGAEMSVPLSRGRRIKRCDIANCRSVKKLKRERLPVFLSFPLLKVGWIGFYLCKSPFLDIEKMKLIMPQKALADAIFSVKYKVHKFLKMHAFRTYLNIPNE